MSEFNWIPKVEKLNRENLLNSIGTNTFTHRQTFFLLILSTDIIDDGQRAYAKLQYAKWPKFFNNKILLKRNTMNNAN